MKQINKTYYWIGLLLFFTIILLLRYFGNLIELRKEFFYIIFGIWICLLLLPLFVEIEFLGIKLKKDFEDFKKEVKNEITTMRIEFHNSNKQQIFLNYGPMPSDQEIEKLNSKIPSIIEENQLTNDETDINTKFKVSDSTLDFLKIRFSLEEILYKVWFAYSENFEEDNGRIISPAKMLNDLERIKVIDSNISHISRGILSICNSVIHGKTASEEQNEFVLKNSPIIYDTLKKYADRE